MGLEIERKFLVAGDSWRCAVGKSTRIAQGYLCFDPERCVRVRLAGEHAWITIKGAQDGLTRAEFEFSIPPGEAAELLRMCLPAPISKTRHEVAYGGHIWEIDVFEGANEGLSIAEVEMADEDETVDLPPWAGREVSDDPRFLNANLAVRPYREFRGEI